MLSSARRGQVNRKEGAGGGESRIELRRFSVTLKGSKEHVVLCEYQIGQGIACRGVHSGWGTMVGANLGRMT